MLVREPAPAHQITAVSTNGYRTRWGYDELDAEQVPSGLQWGTSIPGGADTLRCVLPRDPERAYSDTGLLTELQVSRDGGRTMRFRLDETPKVSGDQMAVEPAAKGYRAALEDSADVRALFVSRDISGWGSMSRDRRIAILQAAYGTQPVDPSTLLDVESGLPAVLMEFDGEWAANYEPICEAFWGDQDTPEVARITGSWQRVNASSTSFAWRVRNATANSQAALAAGYSGSDLQNEPNATGDFDVTFSTPRPVVCLEFVYEPNSAVSNPGTKYTLLWRAPALFGNTGLTPVGSPEGFYTGPMLEWLIDSKTSISVGTVDDGTFLHTHAAYLDPSTALSIVENLSRYEPLYDWMVYDDFQFRRRGTYGRRWRARVGPSGLRSSGESLERLYNEVAVKVSDPLYGDLIVGPTGSDYANTADGLIDTDPDNPANRAGITRRMLLDIGTGTIEGAAEVGRRFLDESKRLDNSGQCELTGFVEDEAGIAWPVDEVRAGDEIQFSDAADTSWRRISATSYSHDFATNALTLDAPAQTMDALLARLGAVLVPLN